MSIFLYGSLRKPERSCYGLRGLAGYEDSGDIHLSAGEAEIAQTVSRLRTLQGKQGFLEELHEPMRFFGNSENVVVSFFQRR